MQLPDYHSILIDKPGVPDSLWSLNTEPCGEAQFSLRVYDREIIIQGLDPQVIPYLDRLRIIEGNVPCTKKQTITARQSPIPQYYHHSMNNGVLTVKIEPHLPEVVCYNSYCAAKLNIENDHITLFVSQSTPATVANELENIMRVYLTLTMFKAGVLFFHSSAVKVKGVTYVFFGPHAAGKSTIALLAPADATVLGDDLNALILKSGQSLKVTSLPFPSECIERRTLISETPIALFRIEKSDETSIEPMSISEKMAALLGSVPVFNILPSFLEPVREKLLQIIEQIPIFKLYFPQSREVYSWLEQNQHLLLE